MRPLGTLIAVALFLGACGASSAAPQAAPATPTISSGSAPSGTLTPVTLAPSLDIPAAAAQLLSSVPEGSWAIDTVAAFKAARAAGAYVIDVREPSEYAAGHIAGAVNIPLRTIGANLDKIPTDRLTIVHCRTSHRAGMATAALQLLGYTNVRDFVPAMQGWQAANEPVVSDPVPATTFGVTRADPRLVAAVGAWLKAIPSDNYGAGTTEQLKKLQAFGGVTVVDVREPNEYMAGHIPGAINIPLRDLAKSSSRLPRDMPIALYAMENHRAAMSVTALQLMGFANARIFGTAFSGWQAGGERVEVSEAPR